VFGQNMAYSGSEIQTREAMKEKFRKFWGFHDGQWVPCWYPNCNNQANDVAHIDQKGMGGRDSAEYIENGCALCRECHKKTEGVTEEKPLLYWIIVVKIWRLKPGHQWSERFRATQFFKENETEILNGPL